MGATGRLWRCTCGLLRGPKVQFTKRSSSFCCHMSFVSNFGRKLFFSRKGRWHRALLCSTHVKHTTRKHAITCGVLSLCRSSVTARSSIFLMQLGFARFLKDRLETIYLSLAIRLLPRTHPKDYNSKWCFSKLVLTSPGFFASMEYMKDVGFADLHEVAEPP